MTLIGLGLVAAAAGPALAANEPEAEPASTTWALQPADAAGPDGRVSLRHVLDGGAGASDHVALTNFGERPATFAVYASDGTVTDDGLFDLLPAGEEATGAGSWITVSPGEVASVRDGGGVTVQVPAASTVTLPVEIDVPSGATPGDHPVGVVAELVRGGERSIGVASRVGVRVHLRVAGDVVAELVPQVLSASYRPSWNPFARGTLEVEVEVANAGNVRLGSRTVVTTAGPWGAGRAERREEVRELLPGQSASVVLELPVVPLFRAGGDVGVEPVVVGEDDVDVRLEPGTASFTAWAVPWSQIALVLLIVGSVVAGRVLRRRAAVRVQARIDAAVAEATARPVGSRGDEPSVE
ncbi:COG1470 family protein [Cellulomonas dongxiuzhuiae]|uniref:DUF916 domain-containing protein n=1 Tax=Cellulomonas dongxiuzhuiae TaxID=2819979 RepID=A0ABX8GNQ4_9CELL|nr:hypothetical protein [Cellulomonas dongxiuzhuiae]MBO3096001.1 hypothetical protein [Cellulomonas dongxiuzhuiae]QWC17287.1 hypothetical protein KKR89_06805 [Cellulomonas dongxiuzhuiae]